MAMYKTMTAKDRRIILAHVDECLRLRRRWYRFKWPAPISAYHDVRAASVNLQNAIEALSRRREPKPPRAEKAGKP
jgi:hypothetical protein